MNEPSDFDLAAAMEAWRGELTLKDVLSAPDQAELSARLTTSIEELVDQGYSESEAFARAKEGVGGNHGDSLDALGALWRLRRLAKWEAARWALVGVAVVSCFQLLTNLIMCFVTFSWNLKGSESFDELLPLINDAGMVSKIGIALIAAGIGCRAIVQNSRLFKAWWHYLSTRLALLLVIIAMLHSVVSVAQEFAWRPSISRISEVSYQGLIRMILQSHSSFIAFILLSGLVQWKIRSSQFPKQLGSDHSNRAAWPTQTQWQWMVAGIISLSLMSFAVWFGSTVLLNSLRFYEPGTSGLLQAFLMLSVSVLAWFAVDVPVVQAVGKWLLRRPWRLLASGALLIVLSQYFSTPILRWEFLFIYIPLGFVVPIVLILWMKCSARTKRSRLT